MSGRHVAKSSSERSIAIGILSIGSLAVLGSLLGGIWVVRAGAVVAVVMAVVAVSVAWMELKREREEHREEIKRQVAIRVEQAERHHAESIAMIDRFNERAQNLKSMIAKLRRQLGAANSELSTMRGNSAWLRGEVAERQSRIDALEAKIAELEERLVAEEEARQEIEQEIEEASNIVELPRYAKGEEAIELWISDDEHPTMVDLAKLNMAHYDEPVRKEA